MRSSSQNFSKKTMRYLKNSNKKSSFFHSSSKINNYYFIIFLRRPILDFKFSLMTSTTTKGSSLNWAILSMKYFLVLKLISLYPFEYSEYPTNRHSWLWGSKSLLLSNGVLAHALEPKILKWDTSGLCPLQASKGVIPSSCLWGTLF